MVICIYTLTYAHTEQTLQGLLLNGLGSFPQTKGPVIQRQSMVSLQPPGMLGAETGEGRKHLWTLRSDDRQELPRIPRSIPSPLHWLGG